MAKAYDYKDLTFVIPIHIDSIVRLENLVMVVDCLKQLNANIVIHECGKYGNRIIRNHFTRKKNTTYLFSTSDDVVFYRTAIINKTMKYVTTPFVSVWDADVIVDCKQIQESMDCLRLEQCDISFPYDGDFLNVDYVFRECYFKNRDIRLLCKHFKYFNRLYGDNFVGGGFLINRIKYIKSGSENEKFYGWGPEDLDRVLRWHNMGFHVHRSKGPMFHLCHPRDSNGYMRSEIHNDLCTLQLANSRYSSQEEIKKRANNNRLFL